MSCHANLVGEPWNICRVVTPKCKLIPSIITVAFLVLQKWTWTLELKLDWLIELGINDMSTLVGHFVSSPREREKRVKRASRRDQRGTGVKGKEWKWRNRRNKTSITKTCLYNFGPLKPHFCIVILGFTGVYIIFLISAQKWSFLKVKHILTSNT